MAWWHGMCLFCTEKWKDEGTTIAIMLVVVTEDVIDLYLYWLCQPFAASSVFRRMAVAWVTVVFRGASFGRHSRELKIRHRKEKLLVLCVYMEPLPRDNYYT